MKKLFLTLIAFSFVLFLTACGTNDNANLEETDPTTGGEENMENTIATSIDMKDNGDAVFVIENEAQEEQVLTYNSSQEVEYQLLDEEKNIVFTYSANKMFTQAIQENKLASNDKVEILLDLSNEIAAAGVPTGSYTLVVWSTAKEIAEQKVEIEYEWDGGSKAEATANQSGNGNNNSEQTPGTVNIYRGDSTASYVEPSEATIDPDKDLVQEIFGQLETNVTLENYSFENEGKTLVLNMSGIAENVQGSAGEYIFVGSILHSYFDNFPALEEIIFQENGEAATLSHMGPTETFTRDDVYTKPE